MTVNMAAQVLGVSETTVRRRFHSGTIDGRQNGHTREITLRDSSVHASMGYSEDESNDLAAKRYEENLEACHRDEEMAGWVGD